MRAVAHNAFGNFCLSKRHVGSSCKTCGARRCPRGTSPIAFQYWLAISGIGSTFETCRDGRTMSVVGVDRKWLAEGQTGAFDPNRKSGSAASDEMPRLKTRSTIGLHFSYLRLILWVCEDTFLRREDIVRGWQLALSLRGVCI
jgi:hypothetical protein